MLTVITWKWRPSRGYRSKFESHHVNVLRRMVARNYLRLHEFVCVTDDPAGLDEGIRVVKLWDELGDLPSPHGPGNPSCYRRLRMFSPEAEELFGSEFVSLDLDAVITGRLEPIFDRDDEFVMWGDTNYRTAYNGSLIRMKAGARRQVWDRFDPTKSPAVARQAGNFGSDQAWISFVLGPGEKKYGPRDGVYSYRNQIRTRGGRLPTGARIVFFHGHVDPWSPEAQALPWVRDHWR